MTKYHYKLSSKPIEKHCYVVFTKGDKVGEVHKVQALTDLGSILATQRIYPNPGLRVFLHGASHRFTRPLRIRYSRGLA